MPIELNKGNFFVTTRDETMLLGNGIPFTEEIELSAKESPSHIYHFDTSSVNFEIIGTDLTKLDKYFNFPQFNEKFIIEGYLNIMIQARWHKKPRIRKKWLKRFGMKKDTVKIKANATAGEYHTNDGGFDFETDVLEYLWRPDQLRSGLKIER